MLTVNQPTGPHGRQKANEPPKEKGGSIWYLLVEEGPEHGQWDVEDQNPHHHLHLLDQLFLLGEGRSVAKMLNSAKMRAGGASEACCGYRVLLLGPVQPVLPVWVVL